MVQQHRNGVFFVVIYNNKPPIREWFIPPIYGHLGDGLLLFYYNIRPNSLIGEFHDDLGNLEMRRRDHLSTEDPNAWLAYIHTLYDFNMV